MAKNTPNLHICPNVYEPREDSYLLASVVEKFAKGNTLDLGTGTGIQGITAAMKGCKVTFADISETALNCAKENASANHITGEFVQSNLFSNICGKFDTIIFNPPYLHSKPLAKSTKVIPYLDGGVNGRELIDRFLCEYGAYTEKGAVTLLLESSINGFEQDIKRLNAEVVSRERLFFEELVVLKF